MQRMQTDLNNNVDGSYRLNSNKANHFASINRIITKHIPINDNSYFTIYGTYYT